MARKPRKYTGTMTVTVTIDDQGDDVLTGGPPNLHMRAVTEAIETLLNTTPAEARRGVTVMPCAFDPRIEFLAVALETPVEEIHA